MADWWDSKTWGENEPVGIVSDVESYLINSCLILGYCKIRFSSNG